jgi:hypothetical protein
MKSVLLYDAVLNHPDQPRRRTQTPDAGFAHLILGGHIHTLRVVIDVLTTNAGGATMLDKVAYARNAVEALTSRGVKFETGVLEYPWGCIAVFQDPDGNRLQLRELRDGR